MKVQIKKAHPNAKTPTRATTGSAGYDLYAVDDCEVAPNLVKLIDIGIQLDIEPGYVGLVCPRSGLALKNNIRVANGPGVVDSDYRGNVGVILANDNNSSFSVKAGMKVAQMVFVKAEVASFDEVTLLDDTSRGSGGFGSTGQ